MYEYVYIYESEDAGLDENSHIDRWKNYAQK